MGQGDRRGGKGLVRRKGLCQGIFKRGNAARQSVMIQNKLFGLFCGYKTALLVCCCLYVSCMHTNRRLFWLICRFKTALSADLLVQKGSLVCLSECFACGCVVAGRVGSRRIDYPARFDTASPWLIAHV